MTESMQHLSGHVHQQHGSNRSLGLAISLLWSVEGVGLKNTEQILLPAQDQNADKSNI